MIEITDEFQRLEFKHIDLTKAHQRVSTDLKLKIAENCKLKDAEQRTAQARDADATEIKRLTTDNEKLRQVNMSLAESVKQCDAQSETDAKLQHLQAEYNALKEESIVLKYLTALYPKSITESEVVLKTKEKTSPPPPPRRQTLQQRVKAALAEKKARANEMSSVSSSSSSDPQEKVPVHIQALRKKKNIIKVPLKSSKKKPLEDQNQRIGSVESWSHVSSSTGEARQRIKLGVFPSTPTKVSSPTFSTQKLKPKRVFKN